MISGGQVIKQCTLIAVAIIITVLLLSAGVDLSTCEPQKTHLEYERP